ncbi:MAG: AAA family ATPase [Pseudomonadota bacterium]
MALIKAKTQPVQTVTVAREINELDLLIEDLNEEFEDAWLAATPAEARSLIEAGDQPELTYVVVAVDSVDEADLTPWAEVIRAAKRAGLGVLLVVHDLSAAALHQLMQLGADTFAPYPLPEMALRDAIERLDARQSTPDEKAGGSTGRNGIVLPVYGVAGGVGATTFAVNLAWELSLATRKTNQRIALLDFNFQYGSVATYLDLARREAIYELLSEPSRADETAFKQALTSFRKRIAVLTAPSDALPLDIVAPQEIDRLLELATSSYDYVVVDMPQALVHWSEHVLRAAETFFAILEIDMRSAQNALRFLRALKAEELPYEKVQLILNRAPGFADRTGKARVKRLSESLGVDFNILLPDGGRSVTNACDMGEPLAESAASNALRKEIRKIAAQTVEQLEARKAAVK